MPECPAPAATKPSCGRNKETGMVEIKMSNPAGLGKPMGPYCQVSRVKASEFVFFAGQTATDQDGKIVGADDFEAQCKQIFANIEIALQSVGATWANVVHFTNYLVHREDQPRFVKYRVGVFPTMFPNGAYPPNTILFIDKLLHKEFLVEVQAVAAI
jgi:enamine deaminase RidA (YjgF/YER057c/UK114 family)